MEQPEFIRTEAAENTLAMCKAVLDARPHCRIGQITGQPGTGKSALTFWLTEEMEALRIECWTRISDKDLLRLIVEAANATGIAIDPSGTGNTLFKRLIAALEGRLIIVDEANHLKWAQLEILRSLSDLGRCGLILVGTDILSRTIASATVSTYLAQLRQRIGAKMVATGPLTSDDEIAAYCVVPRFGKVSRSVARQFRKLTGGYWRAALELGDACERLMKAEGIDKLDEVVVQTAAAFMAGAR
ncbi:MAG: ATP-binding protein [Paracoccus sp. (in: a-proteobacteria)]|nr:ATP-binding protein [Paracoccus sp. (in: a-proteobacteria)]